MTPRSDVTARSGAAASPPAVTLTPVVGLPEIRTGDDLAGLVVHALRDNGIQLCDGDVLVISCKVVSKSRGLSVVVTTDRDRECVVAGETRRVVAERATAGGLTRIVESAAGPVMAAAGVDASNTGADGVVLLLPRDPDQVARELLAAIGTAWQSTRATVPGVEAPSARAPAIGLILSDTAGRAWRVGQTDFALGAAGIETVDDLRGAVDADGRDLAVTVRAVADEIAAAADLVKGKSAAVPVAHIRGLAVLVGADLPTGAWELIRTGPADWFGHGRVEAVRASLGVDPGSTLAAEIGIPSTEPEPLSKRVARAMRLALQAGLGASMSAGGGAGGVTVTASDPFELGVATARLTAALWSEGLRGAPERVAGRDDTVIVAIGEPGSPWT